MTERNAATFVMNETEQMTPDDIRNYVFTVDAADGSEKESKSVGYRHSGGNADAVRDEQRRTKARAHCDGADRRGI